MARFAELLEQLSGASLKRFHEPVPVLWRFDPVASEGRRWACWLDVRAAHEGWFAWGDTGEAALDALFQMVRAGRVGDR